MAKRSYPLLKCLGILVVAGLIGSAGTAVAKPAAKKPAVKKPAAKKPAVRKSPARPAANQVKGQAQLAGQNGQFGTVYSLQSGFNFAVLSARYSVDPLPAYNTMTAGTDEKLLVLDFAIKNAKPEDNWFNLDDLFTIVDDKGQLYSEARAALTSKGFVAPDMTLRPGQGMGQPDQKDPLRVAVRIPAKVRVVKVMVNQGRLGRPDEKVIRYYVAGATKAEAGEDGDPKNTIAALPDGVRDPADASGAVALDEGKGTPGAAFPSGGFSLRLDGLAYTTEALLEDKPLEEGKRFAVATVTAKCLTAADATMFEVEGGDGPLYEITDADGERYQPAGYLKAKQNENAEHTWKVGDQYTFRVVFTVPTQAPAKKLILGTGGSRKWAYDVSNAK